MSKLARLSIYLQAWNGPFSLVQGERVLQTCWPTGDTVGLVKRLGKPMRKYLAYADQTRRHPRIPDFFPRAQEVAKWVQFDVPRPVFDLYRAGEKVPDDTFALNAHLTAGGTRLVLPSMGIDVELSFWTRFFAEAGIVDEVFCFVMRMQSARLLFRKDDNDDSYSFAPREVSYEPANAQAHKF